jgi:hypothetical protein
MAKWEYCKLVQGIAPEDQRPTGMKTLTPEGGNGTEIDNLDCELAQLGVEG